MGGLSALADAGRLSFMNAPSSHRRRVKHFDEPGDFHELTFSCYHRMPLLTNDDWRKQLSVGIQRANERYGIQFVAFVFMPEHVHLLVFPPPQSAMKDYLYAVKRPFSFRIKQLLMERDSPLLLRLTVPDKRKGTVFRFWQKGPGYDRNLQHSRSLTASIDYIHHNPVRRGLCERAMEWKWSSARWYVSDRSHVDPDLPTIHGPPAGSLDD
jgi:putative transposase